MKAIIDRLEGTFAVLELENNTFIDIPLNNLPSNVKEGDCLIVENNKYTIDKNETELRQNRIQSLMDELFED